MVGLLTLALWPYRGRLQSLSPQLLKGLLLQWGFWQGAALYVMVYSFSIRPFVPIPPTLYTLAGGLTFGPLWGTILTDIGATINASITFLLARYFGREWVVKHARGGWANAQRRLSGAGFVTILLVRLSPVGPPYDLVSYAAGVTGIRFRDYFWATALGILPAVAAYSYFGEAITKGVVGLLTALFGLVLLSIALPWLWKKTFN